MKAMKFFLIIMASALLAAGCGESKKPETLAGEALAAAGTGDWAKCVKLCDEALAKAPQAVDVLVLKSIALNASGAKTEALAAARKAAELGPNSFPAMYMYGYLTLAEPGRERKSIEELTLALRLDPMDVNTLLLLGEAAGRLNDDDTDLYFSMLPPEYSGNVLVQSRLGIFYASRGRGDAAGKAFAAAYRAAPSNPAAVLNLARYLDYYAGDRIGAGNRYQEYLSLTRSNPALAGTRTLVEGRLNAISR